MNRPDDEGQREPFTSQELESLWKVLPNLLDEYGRLGQPIAKYSHSEYVTVIPNVSTKSHCRFRPRRSEVSRAEWLRSLTENREVAVINEEAASPSTRNFFQYSEPFQMFHRV
jgi:hypothetical protein